MRNKELGMSSPFLLMRRLSDEFERMFEEFNVRKPFALAAPEVPSFDWTPTIELVAKENKLFVRAELPGLTKEDVKIDVTDELLTIRGERKIEKEEKEKGVFRTERFYGTFYRRIPLPEGARPDIAKAIFNNGILEIEVPVEVKKPVTGRQLPIEEPAAKVPAPKELVGV